MVEEIIPVRTCCESRISESHQSTCPAASGPVRMLKIADREIHYIDHSEMICLYLKQRESMPDAERQIILKAIAMLGVPSIILKQPATEKK